MEKQKQSTHKKKLFLNIQNTQSMETIYRPLFWLKKRVRLHKKQVCTTTSNYWHSALSRTMLFILCIYSFSAFTQYNYIVEVSGLQHARTSNPGWAQWVCEEDNSDNDDMNYEFDCYETNTSGRNYNNNVFIGYTSDNETRRNPRNRDYMCGDNHGYVIASGHNRPASITNLQFWIRTTGDDGAFWDCTHGGDCNGSWVNTDYNYRDYPMYQWNEQVLNASGSGRGWVSTRWGNYYANPQTDYGNGEWLGAFYDNTNFTTYKGYMTENETFDVDFANINENDGTQDYRLFGKDNVTQQSVGYVYTESFSARYRMRKNFIDCGVYSFTVGGDDGYRFKIDGVTVIDNWADGGYRTSTISAYLTSGNHDLEIEYYENSGDNRLLFEYSLTTNPPTNPTLISGNNAICSGESTTLTTDGSIGYSGTYVWYQGGCGDDAFDENWNTQPYIDIANTTINSNANGILNLTSTSNDPMINMPNLGSFDASVYKYINIRYKTISSTNAQIYFSKQANNGGLSESQRVDGNYINDGNWHTVSIDMGANANWTGSITGWRFDWAAHNNSTVEIDFISLSQYPIIGEGGSVTVSPTLNTTYAVKIKGYCSNTTCATKTIIVDPKPTGTPVLNTLYLCNPSAELQVNSLSPAGTTVNWTKVSGNGTSPVSGNPATVTGLSSNSTTVYKALLNNGVCTNIDAGNVLIAVPALQSNVLTTESECGYCVVKDGDELTFYGTNNKVIARLTDLNSSPVELTGTEVCVNIVSTAQFVTTNTGSQQPYMRRVLAVTPQQNSPTTVRFYFTEADFQDLKTAAQGTPFEFFNVNELVVTKLEGKFPTPDSNPVDATLIFPNIQTSSSPGDYYAEFTVSTFSTFYIHPNQYPFSPLPIELESFTGFYDSDMNVSELRWITASEINVSHFEAQRSKDGIIWEVVDVVQALGGPYAEASYIFNDENPFEEGTYYRLKIIDHDEAFSYSDIVYLKTKNNTPIQEMKVFPNPIKDKLMVQMYSSSKKKITIQLVELSGKVMKKQKETLVTGTNNIIVSTDNISGGVFVLVCIDEFGNRWSEYILKY